MSIHYLLDGYNVIHKMPSVLELTKLEDRRRQLIRFIEQVRPQGSPNNRVTVIFDGNVDMFGGMKSSAAKVIFSQGESADDTIKKIVTQAKNVKDMIIVSDDRSVQYAVRALGAKTSGVRAFLEKAKAAEHRTRPAGRTKGSATGPQKHISKSEESKINAELGKIWLGPEKKRKD